MEKQPYKCNTTKESFIRILASITGIGYGEILHYADLANKFQVRLPEAVEEHWDDARMGDAEGDKAISSLKRLQYCLLASIGQTLSENGCDTDDIPRSYIASGLSVDFKLLRPDTLKPYGGIWEIADYIKRILPLGRICQEVVRNTGVRVALPCEIFPKIDVFTTASWTAGSREEYGRKETAIREYEVDNDLFEMFAWCVAACYEYWVLRKEERNYVNLNILLKKDPSEYSREDIGRIVAAVDSAEVYFSDL